MTELSTAILEKCRQGSATAFAQVVDRFERPLLGYVYRMGCTPPSRDVEDVVQEILVKAYQNMQSYQGRPGTAFSTWLFAIARNHCVSLMRRKRVEDQWTQTRSSPGLCHSDPADHVAQAETVEQIRQAVVELPETMRSTFILRYYQDMAYSQIAQILECNEGTVRSRLARAKKAIQEHLRQLNEQPRETS